MSRGADGVYRLSNSEIKTWKRCNRKWWFAYYRRLSPAARSYTGPLSIGTRVHLGLATYYSGDFDINHALQVYDNAAMNDIQAMRGTSEFSIDTSKLESEIDLGRIMLEGYFDWVEETGADSGLKLVLPESIIEAPSGIDNVMIRGRLDARFERPDGRRVVMDHKTAASLSQIEDTIYMDEQFRMYHLLERLEAWAKDESQARMTDGAIVNVLRKVKRTERATPPFYERFEVRHNDTDIRNFYTRIHGVIRQIMQAEDMLNAGVDHHYAVPPNPTRDCRWDCPFYNVCPMTDDGSRAEDFIANYFVVHDPDKRYSTEEESTVA